MLPNFARYPFGHVLISIKRVEVEPFSVGDAQKIVAAAERHDAGAIMLTAILLGLREGEVLGLQWANVDLDAGILKVRTHSKREAGAFV